MSLFYLKIQEENILNNHYLKFFFLLLVFFFQNSISEEKKIPILLESNSAKWDEESQISTYRGDVIVKQGKLNLYGDI